MIQERQKATDPLGPVNFHPTPDFPNMCRCAALSRDEFHNLDGPGLVLSLRRTCVLRLSYEIALNLIQGVLQIAKGS